MESTKIKRTVILDFDIEGLHWWDQAPEQVEFLKWPHRHLFQIRVGYDVSHGDREKEIFIQTDLIKEYLHESYGYPCFFEGMSCEHIAQDILEFIKEDGGYFVEVFEDSKGGARVEL